MSSNAALSLSAEHRHEVASWIAANLSSLPEPVRLFLAPHQKYLAAGGNLRQQFDATTRELRRALGITPSSERRRSGNPLASLPARSRGAPPQSKRERLEQQRDRSHRLGKWHDDLKYAARRYGRAHRPRHAYGNAHLSTTSHQIDWPYALRWGRFRVYATDANGQSSAPTNWYYFISSVTNSSGQDRFADPP